MAPGSLSNHKTTGFYGVIYASPITVSPRKSVHISMPAANASTSPSKTWPRASTINALSSDSGTTSSHVGRPYSPLTWRSQAVNRGEWIDPTHAGVHGLIGSLAKEYEEWQVRLVDGPPPDETFLDGLLRVPADPRGGAWAYRAGEWYRQQMIACELEDPAAAPYRLRCR